MAFDYLLCPACRCPLTPSSRSANGIACPRCNTWVELDSACNGGCVSCYKTRGADKSMTSCTGDDIAVPVTIETGTVAKRTGTPENSLYKRAGMSFKALFQKIFAVR